MSQQQEPVVRLYRRGAHILVAELCRPRTRNAFNDDMYAKLVAAIAEYEADAALHALVITGHGAFFTSGSDVAAAFESMNPERDGAVVPSKGWAKQFMHAMLGCSKLIVAAVNGRAIGIGVTLLLHCDLVFAADSATFWTPFMRIGIVPEFASSYTFPTVLVRMRGRVLGLTRCARRAGVYVLLTWRDGNCRDRWWRTTC